MILGRPLSTMRQRKARAPQYFPAALRAIECGMRRGEIINLKWPDVDFRGRSITVRKSRSGKQRKLVMSERLTSVMRSLKCREHCEHIFLNRNGKPYQDFRGAHRHAMKRAGLEEVRKKEQLPALRFHDLRHTCGTLLEELLMRPQLSWIEQRTSNPQAAGSNPAGRVSKQVKNAFVFGIIYIET